MKTPKRTNKSLNSMRSVEQTRAQAEDVGNDFKAKHSVGSGCWDDLDDNQTDFM